MHRIDACGLLNQLSKEVVLDYTVSPVAHITDIVDDLLAMQVSADPITKGTIAPTNEITIQVTEDSILGVLQRIREQVGGYIYIDNNRALQWPSTLGADDGRQIRYNRDLVNITRTIDYAKLANRIYAYGDGVVLPADYVEDATSQAAYGYCAKSATDLAILDQATLITFANTLLAQMKEPLITYGVQILNLEALGLSGALALGDVVHIIDEELSIDIEAAIVKIVRDLTNPLKMEIEISGKPRDVTQQIGVDYRWKREFY